MSRKSAILMTENNWAWLFGTAVAAVGEMIDERATTFGEAREELDSAIKDTLQKVIPTLYAALEKHPEQEAIKELYHNIQRLAGYVIPEGNEDLAKQLIIELPND